MRIALIHTRITRKGGLETRLLNYQKYFAEKGHSVYLYTVKYDRSIQLERRTKVIQVPVRFIPRVFRALAFQWYLKLREDVSIFDFTLSLERTAVQDRLIAPNTHKGYLNARRQSRNHLTDYIQLYLDKISYKRAVRIYACSQMIKNEIISYYSIPESKIVVLHPPLQTQTFHTSQDPQSLQQFREKWGIDITKKNFAFVSTSHRTKGLDLLIDIFKKPEMSSYHLWIAGSRAETGFSNIHTLGFVQHPEYLYASVNALLHPAIYEPFGQIVSEALACGIPAFVSDQTGASELIEPHTGLVLSRKDPLAWENAILHFDSSNYSIPENWAFQHKLDLESHMKILLAPL